jgi:hypothetical protein
VTGRENESRSAHLGCAASYFRKRVKSTVATSAIPMGMPGWPLAAFEMASADKNRIAFAIESWLTAAAAVGASFMKFLCFSKS